MTVLDSSPESSGLPLMAGELAGGVMLSRALSVPAPPLVPPSLPLKQVAIDSALICMLLRISSHNATKPMTFHKIVLLEVAVVFQIRLDIGYSYPNQRTPRSC